MESVRPLVEALQEAVRIGAFVELDAELLAYDLVLLAHGWALKSWYFEPQHTFDSYVRGQLRLVLAAAVAPERRRARGPASGEARKSAPRAVPESVQEPAPGSSRESARNPPEMRRYVMTVEHEFEDIRYEIRGAAAVITMNRPRRYNAFRSQTV